MNLELRPFKAADLHEVAEDFEFAHLIDYETARFIEHQGLAYTGVVDGKIIGCGGLYERWPGRFETFAFLGKVTGRHSWGVVTRAARELFARARAKGAHRIEADVDADFSKGKRWVVRLLDMTPETPAGRPRYSPDGRNFYLYARTW